MGERIKVKFTKNYIAAVGQSISGVKDQYKVYPVTDQLQKLIDEGTCELVSGTEASTRETATVEAPEQASDAEAKPEAKKKTKSSEK